ncbi:MAG: hypothetical protein M3P49_04970, partial [Actinomycetota bacterium]|nr:hypothetical protein [Actinomycetota bacterium]
MTGEIYYLVGYVSLALEGDEVVVIEEALNLSAQDVLTDEVAPEVPAADLPLQQIHELDGTQGEIMDTVGREVRASSLRVL